MEKVKITRTYEITNPANPRYGQTETDWYMVAKDKAEAKAEWLRGRAGTVEVTIGKLNLVPKKAKQNPFDGVLGEDYFECNQCDRKTKYVGACRTCKTYVV